MNKMLFYGCMHILQLLVSNNTCLINFMYNGIFVHFFVFCTIVNIKTLLGIAPVLNFNQCLPHRFWSAWCRACIMSETVAAMLTCIPYPWLCRQTSETTGLTLQGLPTVTVLLHEDVCMCVLWGVRVDPAHHKSPPLIIWPCCLLFLWAPGSWLDSYVAKSNLRDSLGIASGWRKQGHWKRQTITQLYTCHWAGWAVKATRMSLKQKWDLQ